VYCKEELCAGWRSLLKNKMQANAPLLCFLLIVCSFLLFASSARYILMRGTNSAMVHLEPEGFGVFSTSLFPLVPSDACKNLCEEGKPDVIFIYLI
jgi:hypothetical protein